MHGVAMSYGDITVTVQASGDYDGMAVEDMVNQARHGVITLLDALPDVVEADTEAEAPAPGLTHNQAMRRDLLQDDE